LSVIFPTGADCIVLFCYAQSREDQFHLLALTILCSLCCWYIDHNCQSAIQNYA